jgi:hypothetical protein
MLNIARGSVHPHRAKLVLQREDIYERVYKTKERLKVAIRSWYKFHVDFEWPQSENAEITMERFSAFRDVGIRIL